MKLLRLRMLVMCLMLGAIINIAVAWVCMYFNRIPWGGPYCFERSASPSLYHECLVTIRHCHGVTGVGVMRAERSSGIADGNQVVADLNTVIPSWATWCLHEFRINMPLDVPYRMRMVYGSGWPCVAMTGWIDGAPSIYQGGKRGFLATVPASILKRTRLSKDLPLRPSWPGFAINTVFYATILWLLFAASGFVRRRIRARRGQCPACAYPVGTSDVCTECGRPVRPHTRS